MPPASPQSPQRPAGSLVDPAALMAIRNLELRAKMVVEGFWNGLHRSPYHGFSVEFTEYRQYTPGDDPRYLDWRVYGRTDRHYIKRFEDETNLRCHLLVDQSRSMAFSSRPGGATKADYAATLAATLAWFLHLQGDATGLIAFDDGVRDYLPARHRASHLRQLMLALDRPATGRGTDLVAPVERAASILRKRGWVVLISDFLAPPDRLEQALTLLAAGGHELTLFQVLDPAEVAFDFKEPAWFEDAESGRSVFIDPEAARAGYQQRLERHFEGLRAIGQRLGVAIHRFTTHQPLELALAEFVRDRQARGRRGRPGVRTPAGGGGSPSR